jgi:preprotein translocase subunit SecA
VVALGGLHILGTERHESRRIDNQLRGRSGRQGDPGSSKFYLSLEDDLLRIFGSERVAKIMDFLKIEEGEAITHGMITKAIENAQKKVEAHNFEIRKHLIDYDDVMNKQREVIYTQRREILAGEDIRQTFLEMVDEAVSDVVNGFAVEKVHAGQWDWDGIGEMVNRLFGFQIDLDAQTLDRLVVANFRELLKENVLSAFESKRQTLGDELTDHLIRVIMLQTIDTLWKDHLLGIDHLKEGIGLRGYGQKDPKQEYKKEAFNLFMNMITRVREDVVSKMFWVQVGNEEELEELEELEIGQQKPQKMQFNLAPSDEEVVAPRKPAKSAKVGRNEPCKCGSGKKFKQCCGR